MNPYRRRIWALLEPLLRGCAPLDSVLDFGAGDGWFAAQVRAAGLAHTLTPLDVKRRAHVFVEPVLYPPGTRLPFADRQFDLVYTVDVLHHCDVPQEQIDELCRVSRRYLLVKDHTYATQLGRWTLAMLDELGNRRFGIPSPHHYQRHWEWDEHLTRRGWRKVLRQHPVRCHTGLLGSLTNALQYIALYERESD